MSAHSRPAHVPVRRLALSVAAGLAIGCGAIVVIGQTGVGHMTVLSVPDLPAAPTMPPVRICTAGAGMVRTCTTQDPAVVRGDAIARALGEQASR